MADTKKEILKKLITHFESNYLGIYRAAKSRRREAADSGMKQENKYDTRAIEASYLANGQAKRVHEFKKQLDWLNRFQPKEFGPKDPIDVGALFEVEIDGECNNYFLLPFGGGFEAWLGKDLYKVISSHSPLGVAMQGLKLFDLSEYDVAGDIKEIEILGIE